MTQDTALRQIADILVEVADIDAAEVTPEKNLKEDFDVDSLLLVEITVAIEERFGITVPDEAAADFVTVADLTAFAQEHVAA